MAVQDSKVQLEPDIMIVYKFAVIDISTIWIMVMTLLCWFRQYFLNPYQLYTQLMSIPSMCITWFLPFSFNAQICWDAGCLNHLLACVTLGQGPPMFLAEESHHLTVPGAGGKNELICTSNLNKST